MTSSIPATSIETIAPSAAMADSDGALAAPVPGQTDFAGVLAEAVPTGGTESAPVGTRLGDLPAGRPLSARQLGGGMGRFAVPMEGSVRPGFVAGLSNDDSGSAAPAPTRAEQEGAMALMSALLAALAPAAPVECSGITLNPDEKAVNPPVAGSSAGFESKVIGAPFGGNTGTVVFESPQGVGQFRAETGAPTVVEAFPDGTRPEPTLADRDGLLPTPRQAAGQGGDPDLVAPGQNPLVNAEPGSPFDVLNPGSLEVRRLLAPDAARSGDSAPANEVLAAPSEVAAAEPVQPDQSAVVEVEVVRHDGVRLARRTMGTESPGAELASLEWSVKTAGSVPAKDFSSGQGNRASGKKLLSDAGQELAAAFPDAGTTAANEDGIMKLRLSSTFDFAARHPGAEPSAVESTGGSLSREPAQAAAAGVVSTVLEVVEAQEASKLRPAPAVQLRMQVAGETVGIRVEMRDEAVQTHFTSVSPELREALAREWQVARSEAAHGAPRLLDPVFNTNPDRGGSSSNGHDAASQQQQQARTWGSPWEQAVLPFSRRARPTASPDTTSADAPALDDRLLSAIA